MTAALISVWLRARRGSGKKTIRCFLENYSVSWEEETHFQSVFRRQVLMSREKVSSPRKSGLGDVCHSGHVKTT